MLYKPQTAEAHIESYSSSKPISVKYLTVKNFCPLKGVIKSLSYVYWGI